MPKISEEAKTERRERILAGARRCFARHGYNGATVVRLEQEIGLSRGAIFNWFATKEDLFLELATRDNNRINSIWVERGLEDTVRAIVEEDPDWLGVYLDVVHRLRTDPAFRERWDQRMPKEQENEIVARMKEEQAAGRLRADLEPEQIGKFLGVLFDGLAVQRAAGYDPPLDVLLQLVTETLAPVRGRTRARTSA
jgi:AcrR family transcriptional regulator